eukprot:348889-Pleurochrysis_carterae.AAC.1
MVIRAATAVRASLALARDAVFAPSPCDGPGAAGTPRYRPLSRTPPPPWGPAAQTHRARQRRLTLPRRPGRTRPPA